MSVAFSLDQHVPRTVVDGAHRVRTVLNEVQNDLLKLHTVAAYIGQIVRKFSPQITRFA